LRELEPGAPLTNAATIDALVARALERPQSLSLLVGGFALIALLLSVIGIYGVMAYSVNQRRRELGIRMALGATSNDVLRLVVLQGLRLTLMGVVVGLVASFAASRLIASMLFDVSPTDIITFIAVPVLLAIAALGASYLPALRATRIDPMVALRYE
jgi:putative ABC transport system permease protein